MQDTSVIKQQLEQILAGGYQYLPELLLSGLLFLLLIIDLIVYKRATANVYAAIVIIGLSVVIIAGIPSLNAPVILVNVVKLIILMAGMLTVLLSGFNDQKKKTGEYYIVILGLMIGAMLLVGTTNLLLLYLSIEMLSLSAYVLTGFGFTRNANEAALKYLLFGAVSSAMMLFGISLMYGFTQSLDLQVMDFTLVLNSGGEYAVFLAIILFLIGLLFKMAAVPMHIWVPDVYQTAPTPAVALFSVVPKVASLIVIFKIISLFATQFEFIGLILIVISMISMAVGNFSAIWQNDAKRMLGYSSIAHTGFLLVAIIANSVTGAQAFIYYAVVYLIMNFAAFLAVIAIEKQFATTDMRQYAGLGKYMPWMSVLVVVIMISLTGLPPTAGFTAKLLVFSSLWEAYSVSQNGMLLALFIFGLLNTVVALVYYLKIPYYLFFKETDALPGNVPASGVMMNLLGTILVLLLLLLFFKPDWLMDLIYNIKFAV